MATLGESVGDRAEARSLVGRYGVGEDGGEGRGTRRKRRKRKGRRGPSCGEEEARALWDTFCRIFCFWIYGFDRSAGGGRRFAEGGTIRSSTKLQSPILSVKPLKIGVGLSVKPEFSPGVCARKEYASSYNLTWFPPKLML